MNKVERLRIMNGVSWENVVVDGLISCYEIHGVQISETEVIIAGNNTTDVYRVDMV